MTATNQRIVDPPAHGPSAMVGMHQWRRLLVAALGGTVVDLSHTCAGRRLDPCRLIRESERG